MKRLIRKADNNDLGQIGELSKTKIGYSFKDIIKKTLSYEQLYNAVKTNQIDEDTLQTIIYANKLEQESLYVDLFIKMKGILDLFNHIEEFYGFNDTYNSEIENYLTTIVKNYDKYTNYSLSQLMGSVVESVMDDIVDEDTTDDTANN